MTKEEILSLIRKYFNTEFEIPEDKVVLEARLFDDLELDSIDALDMVAMLESELEIEVEEEGIKGIATVGDVVDYIMGKVAQ
jgi:acyl carrier protein